MDVVAHAESAEKQIDAFIERRSRQPGPDADREDLWVTSVKRYNAAKEAERRALWADFHAEQAERLRRTSTELIAFHEARAAALCQESGRG